MVTRRHEILAKLEVVVDLAVLDHEDFTRLVTKWLISSGEIDDAQTAHAQTNSVGKMESVPVWSAVPDGVDHRNDRFGSDYSSGVEVEDPGDAAHAQEPRWSVLTVPRLARVFVRRTYLSSRRAAAREPAWQKRPRHRVGRLHREPPRGRPGDGRRKSTSVRALQLTQVAWMAG